MSANDGRLERLAPLLAERPRAAAEAAARSLAREAELLRRRRLEVLAALQRLAERAARAYGDRIEAARREFGGIAQMLEAVSYRAVLERGFALVRDETDRPLRRAAEVRERQALTVQFADGAVSAVAAGRGPARFAPRRRTRLPKDPEEQGSLF